MPCAAPSRNNLGVLGPCGFPIVPVVNGVDVSAQNLCLPHYTMKYGLAAIPKGVVGGGIDAYTVFCLHADTLVDERGHPLTAVGDAKIDLTQFKFGSGSLALDGAGDYLTTPDSPDWNLGAGDFTIDLWAYFTNVGASTQTLIGQWLSAGNQQAWLVRWDTAASLKFYWTTDGVTISGPIAFIWTPTANTWYHIAIVRTGNTMLGFINGAQVGTAAFATTIFDSNAALSIGAQASGTWNFAGYLDEIRISKTARWTAPFSVPTAPYS
jgi:hypothetical protein